MSRYIATRAIRGANALVNEAEVMLHKALREKGAETPVAFPNTAYHLPLIFGMTGMAVQKLGDLPPVLKHARELLHPVPAPHHWTPYLGETLDSGMATLLAAEAIEAVRFVYKLQPEPMPGFHLAGGTSFTSPDMGNGGNGDAGYSVDADGHLNGPIDDIQLRSWGIQLVDGRMPGFAAIVGCAKSNEVAVKLVRELQRRNILTFLSGNVNGRSIIHQLMEEGVELGYDTYTVPFGTDTLSAIYALGFATRSALTFGGLKAGQARDILLYNRERVFAFVLALGEVDDLKYAAAAGAINFGFPVIADTVIPEILPTGVTRYEHVVSWPWNEIDGKDDLERAERLVEKCIEVRGVKVKVANVPVPVPYGSAFEGEVVRKADMRVEFGGKYSRAFEYLRMAGMDEVVDGKIEVVGPKFADLPAQGHMDMGIVVEVAGRQMQKDFEPVLERQIHYFINGASGIQHIGQRDIAWIRISTAAADKGFDLEHFGKILHARFKTDFGAIVDKVQVTIYTDPGQFHAWLDTAREAYDYRNKRLADLTDDKVEEFYSCTLCVPPDQDVVLADGSFLAVDKLVESAVENGLRPVMTFDQNHLAQRSMGELFINPAPEVLVRIGLRNGNALTLTANHKILVDRPEGLIWAPAGKLNPGDYLVDALPELDTEERPRPYVVDYLPDDYRVADEAFYARLREWALAKYGNLTDAAAQLDIPYRRLYSALYPHQEVSHQRLTLGELKRVAAALGQNWDDLKGDLHEFQFETVLSRTQLDADLLYIAGLVASDGSVRWRGEQGQSGVFVQFTNTEPALSRRFAAIVADWFGRGPTERMVPPVTGISGDLVVVGRKETTVSVAGNTLLGRLLNGLGIGLPDEEQKWTGYVISSLPNDLVAAFLRGLFDGDGHVTGQRAYFTTRTELEARHIHLLLKKLGIVSYISPITRGYQVATSSDADTIRFRDMVGAEHPAKRARLEAITIRSDSRHVVRNDAVPLSCGPRLAGLLDAYAVPVTKLPVDYKTWVAWRDGQRRPSKVKLAAVLDHLAAAVPADDPDYRTLRAWAEADLRFQKVETVERVAATYDRVYNFSVEETHNYVVNGVVVKNCQSFAPNHVCVISPERLGLCGAYNWLDCKASFSINPTGPNQPIKLFRSLDTKKGYWTGTNDYAKIGSHGVVNEVAMYSIMENPMTACLSADTEVLVDGTVRRIGEFVEAGNKEQQRLASLDERGRQVDSHLLGLHKNPAPETLIRIDTKSGLELVLTPNHEVAVDRWGQNGHGPWLRADEIQAGDRVYALKHLRLPGKIPAAIDLIPADCRVVDAGLLEDLESRLRERFGSRTAAYRSLGLDLPDPRLPSLPLRTLRALVEALGEPWDVFKLQIGAVASPSGQASQALPELDPDLFYLLGLLASDGSLDWQGPHWCRVNFTNSDPSLLARYTEIYHRLFADAPLGERKKGGGGVIAGRKITATRPSTDLYGNNFVLGLLAEAFGLRMRAEDNEGRVWDLARMVGLPEAHIAAFLAGAFDGDGSVRLRRYDDRWPVGEAYLSHSDMGAARHLQLLLKRLGVLSQVRLDGSVARVEIHGGNLRRFAELIPARHPAKAAVLAEIAALPRRLDKTQEQVLPYAAGKALASLPESRSALSRSTLFYYKTGRSRPVADSVRTVVAEAPETEAVLSPWLETDFFLDTVTSAVPVANDGRYEHVYNLSLLDVNSYLANGIHVKNCGCFECIVMLIPEANGVMVVSREDTSMTPAGMTFSTLAGIAGGGLQTPGVMGVGKYYLISPKFIYADGGFKRVVWMSSFLKESMADEFKAAAVREGDPDLIEKIADERSVSTVDDLLAWMEEHNHPALMMDPIF